MPQIFEYEDAPKKPKVQDIIFGGACTMSQTVMEDKAYCDKCNFSSKNYSSVVCCQGAPVPAPGCKYTAVKQKADPIARITWEHEIKQTGESWQQWRERVYGVRDQQCMICFMCFGEVNFNNPNHFVKGVAENEAVLTRGWKKWRETANGRSAAPIAP